LTPLMGKLGDQHGKGRLLAISLAIFLAGCIGAAGAWSIWSLIGFRILQGAGGAVFPLSFAIVNDEFPRERSGAAIGAISAVFGAAGGLGLPLAGLLVDHLSWRWLFVVSAAVVVAGLVAVVALVPESPIKTPTRLDLPGAALLTLVLVPFLVALSEGRNWGWTSGRTLGLFVVSAIALAAWIPRRSRTRRRNRSRSRTRPSGGRALASRSSSRRRAASSSTTASARVLPRPGSSCSPAR
jgi:MFS family permease